MDSKQANTQRKSEMKKQVSFDDSITDTVEAKYVQLNFKEGKMYHSMVSGSGQSDSESLTLTTNMSTMSLEKQPNYRIISFMWAFSLFFALFDTQMMGSNKKCFVSSPPSSSLS